MEGGGCSDDPELPDWASYREAVYVMLDLSERCRDFTGLGLVELASRDDDSKGATFELQPFCRYSKTPFTAPSARMHNLAEHKTCMNMCAFAYRRHAM